ncbi:MAG: DNA-binding response regulator [Pusillimonas sp.]|nr:DNA-binding response regulator [Pusillimonas sp.]
MQEALVYLVDDDQDVTRALACLLESVQLSSRVFHGGAAFLSELNTLNPYACVVLDLRMPELSGMEVLRVMRRRNQTMPAIILSAHGDVPTAVEAMRLGIVDFLQKPFNPEHFLETINIALRTARKNVHELERTQTLDVRMQKLSARERDVLTAMLGGSPSKVIAKELGISYKTVNVHRASVMRKLGVQSYQALMSTYSDYAKGLGVSPDEFEL